MAARIDRNQTMARRARKRATLNKTDAIAALAALAQENRLEAYRLLVQAGPDGMSAGNVAAALGLSATRLSFHFDRLRHARLLSVRRQGRQKIYAAQFGTMDGLLDYLQANCSVEAVRTPRGGRAPRGP